MAKEFSVEVKGLKELDAALRQLPDAMQASPVRNGLKAAAQVLAAGMARRAPRDPVASGVTLAEDIVTRVRISNKRDTAGAQVGPSQKAFHGSFQEFGTEHHAAQPFMRPTLDADGGRAIAAFAAAMKAGLTRAAKRLARLAKRP